jgi:membrane protein implicated in regulation of membrane protease activity
MVALGMLGLYKWSPEHEFIFYLLGLAVVAISLGALFRESRYRWGALFLFAVVIVWAFSRFKDLSEFYQVLTFGAPAVVLLVVSWAYSRGRKKKSPKPAPREGAGAASSDG